MSRDLRRFARQTNVRLLVGFFAILLVVGEGLIYAFWGKGPALMGLLCILAGSAPLIIIWFSMWILELFVKYANRDR